MNDLMLKYRMWKMRRRVSPSREFSRALWKELEVKLPRRAFFASLAWQRLAVPVAVLLLSLGATTTYAYTSPSVAWGHPLFSIKGRGENIEDRFAKSPESDANLRQKKMQRRLAEAERAATDNPELAQELLDTARGEFLRGLDAASRISDPRRRRATLARQIQDDPEQLARIQVMAERQPEAFRTAVQRLLAVEQERLAERLIKIQDEELHALLERRILQRERMLRALYPDAFSPDAALTN